MPSRPTYRQSLDGLWSQMAALAELDVTAIERASLALLDTNRQLAELVISEYSDIEQIADDLENQASELIVRQQPVATDLRLVISSIPIGAALLRMGGLARHVARTTRVRAPESAAVGDVRPILEQMGEAAINTARTLSGVTQTRDADAAETIQASDELMDALYRQLIQRAQAPTWTHPIEAAVDAALLGRFYERFNDQAVTTARRLSFVITGMRPPPRQPRVP